MNTRASWVLVLALQLAGCATVTPPTTTPTIPQRATKFFAVHVVDAQTGTGLSGAIGRIDGGEATADANGRLVFDGVPWDSQAIRLIIEAAGYEDFNDTVLVPLQPTTDLDTIRIKRKNQARPGRVHLNARATADDAGEFNPIGATVMWGLWGYKFDRERLDLNLAWLAERGVDYIRVLGAVGPGGWADRFTDSRWPDYDALLAEFTDHVYDVHGMRVQWTIFGGTEGLNKSERSQLVDRFIRMATGREHKLFLFEVANEGWQNGFGGDDGTAEMQGYARRLKTTGVLTALTSPSGPSGPCDLYAKGDGSIATIHYERSYAADPPGWRPVRQPWGWPGEYEGNGAVDSWACDGKLPPAVNNEPIGPEASVNADDDPRRLVMAYVTTFVAGNSAYVLHAGPGIRGGGAADLARGRHANFWEIPSLDIALRAIQQLKLVLPPGLANWERQNAQWAGHPMANLLPAINDHNLLRSYAAMQGGRFVVVMLAARKALNPVMKIGPATMTVYEPVSGLATTTQTVGKDQGFTLDGSTGYIVVGQVP